MVAVLDAGEHASKEGRGEGDKPPDDNALREIHDGNASTEATATDRGVLRWPGGGCPQLLRSNCGKIKRHRAVLLTGRIEVEPDVEIGRRMGERPDGNEVDAGLGDLAHGVEGYAA